MGIEGVPKPESIVTKAAATTPAEGSTAAPSAEATEEAAADAHSEL